MATPAFSIELLVAPTVRATDIDSVRVFRKKYKELYLKLWQESQEDGTIDKQGKTTENFIEMYRYILLRDRISKYELGKPKNYRECCVGLSQPMTTKRGWIEPAEDDKKRVN